MEIISKKRFAAQLFYLLSGNGDIQLTECVIVSRLQMHCVTEGTCGPLIIITPLLQSLLPFEITLSTAVAQISLKLFFFSNRHTQIETDTDTDTELFCGDLPLCKNIPRVPTK